MYRRAHHRSKRHAHVHRHMRAHAHTHKHVHPCVHTHTPNICTRTHTHAQCLRMHSAGTHWHWSTSQLPCVRGLRSHTNAHNQHTNAHNMRPCSHLPWSNSSQMSSPQVIHARTRTSTHKRHAHLHDTHDLHARTHTCTGPPAPRGPRSTGPAPHAAAAPSGATTAPARACCLAGYGGPQALFAAPQPRPRPPAAAPQSGPGGVAGCVRQRVWPTHTGIGSQVAAEQGPIFCRRLRTQASYFAA